MVSARPIRTLLVANRGEIVVRVARTARAMGMRTVAVFSDADAAAPHVGACDLAVSLGGDRSDETYLDAAKLIDAARRSGADAVHPGYGFLSEDPAFAEACVDAGLTWVGPPADAMRAMAAKVDAKARASELGVPVLPSVTLTGDGPDAWSAAAGEVGYPLLLKASAGGGGRGMRLVADPGELVGAVESARREAAASFGDATVFAERHLAAPRHIEVQVMADAHGRVLHLLERECSIQRRHQKVIEEAPSPAVDPGLRARITDSAVRLAAGIGYVGAGTVEYLVDGDGFFFLEMNTRLQVEHPVTEAVLGLDLVRLQLDVADGRPLAIEQDSVVARGHAIEARLYAEDVPAGFLPAPGTVSRYRRGAAAGVRFDDAIADGTVVSPHYDAMLGKVIAHAPTRAEAALRLARALERTELWGLTTNRHLLVTVLRHDAFLAADTTTAFLDEHAEVLAALPSEPVRRATVVAAALAARHLDRPAGLPAGWRNVPSQPQVRRFAGAAGEEVEVTYRTTRAGMEVSVDGEAAAVHLHGVRPAGQALVVDLDLDGVRRRIRVAPLGDDAEGRRFGCAAPDGHVEWAEPPRFDSGRSAMAGAGPMAPLPGSVVKVAVTAGQSVRAGDVLVVVEAMKMEHAVLAEGDAVVAEVLVSEGDRVDAHQVLLTFDADADADG